eukprot:COSAG02_NODE_1374_length_13005_cov_5.606152_5_plen_512_part_00
MKSPEDARTFLTGLLTCCGNATRAGEACPTCTQINTVQCKCIRCTATCGGNKWAAVPANEQKKTASATDKAWLTVEAARVRKDLRGIPEDLVRDFAGLNEGHINELLATEETDDLRQKLRPSKTYSEKLAAVRKHGSIAPALHRAVARTGELAPASGDAAVNLRAGRSRSVEQTQKLASAAASEHRRLAQVPEVDWSSIANTKASPFDLAMYDNDDDLHAVVAPTAVLAAAPADVPTTAVPATVVEEPAVASCEPTAAAAASLVTVAVPTIEPFGILSAVQFRISKAGPTVVEREVQQLIDRLFGTAVSEGCVSDRRLGETIKIGADLVDVLNIRDMTADKAITIAYYIRDYCSRVEAAFLNRGAVASAPQPPSWMLAADPSSTGGSIAPEPALPPNIDLSHRSPATTAAVPTSVPGAPSRRKRKTCAPFVPLPTDKGLRRRLAAVEPAATAAAGTTSPITTGDAVSALFAPNGWHFDAVVESIDGGMATVNWADGDTRSRLVALSDIKKS